MAGYSTQILLQRDQESLRLGWGVRGRAAYLIFYIRLYVKTFIVNVLQFLHQIFLFTHANKLRIGPSSVNSKC